MPGHWHTHPATASAARAGHCQREIICIHSPSSAAFDPGYIYFRPGSSGRTYCCGKGGNVGRKFIIDRAIQMLEEQASSADSKAKKSEVK